MKAIIPNVYTFTGLLMGRVYLITAPEGLVIVDAGLSNAAGPVLRQLAEAGHKPADVRWIVITHAHPDHVGALPALKRATGAKVVASELETPVIEGRMAVARPNAAAVKTPLHLRMPETRFPPTPVDLTVRGGDVLPVLDGLEVIETPGHAPGHIAFWLRGPNLMFCGDLVMNLPRLRLPFALFTVDMDENIQSIRKAAWLKPEILCFGHGQPLHHAAQPLADFARQFN